MELPFSDKLKTILGEIASSKKTIAVNNFLIIGDPTIQHTLILPKSFLLNLRIKLGREAEEERSVCGWKIHMTPISLIENTI